MAKNGLTLRIQTQRRTRNAEMKSPLTGNAPCEGKKQRISHAPTDSGKPSQKIPAIRGGSSNIPYAAEQGMNSAHQGVKVPCSAENRDFSRLLRRLSGVFRASAAG